MVSKRVTACFNFQVYNLLTQDKYIQEFLHIFPDWFLVRLAPIPIRISQVSRLDDQAIIGLSELIVWTRSYQCAVGWVVVLQDFLSLFWVAVAPFEPNYVIDDVTRRENGTW